MRIMDRFKKKKVWVENPNTGLRHCIHCGEIMLAYGATCALHQDCDCIPRHRCPDTAWRWTCPECGQMAFISSVHQKDYRDELRREHTCRV